jgi:hypothetical protein
LIIGERPYMSIKVALCFWGIVQYAQLGYIKVKVILGNTYETQNF